MKREDLRKAYDTYSAKLSDVVRQLSFAGIAVIWIFRVGDKPGGVAYSKELLYPLGCFVLSLAFDFLHYLYGSIAWSSFNTFKEKSGVDKDVEFKAPGWINYPSIVFFYTKAGLLFVGYLFLLIYIGKQLIGN